MDDGSLDKAFDELEAECTDIIRGMTVEIFFHTLKMSPQYFGRYVASWTYSLNTPVFRSDQTFVYDAEDQGYAPLYKKGDYPAIAVAVSYNTGKDTPFKLGDTVYISNGVDHGEGPYAEGIENGTVNLRQVNQPGRPLGRSIDRAATWYARDVNKNHALELRAMRIY